MTQLPTQHEFRNDSQPYFEMEEDNSMLSGLHAVNNLLGEKFYDQDRFQAFNSGEIKVDQHEDEGARGCKCFGGDYDHYVVFTALKKAGYTPEPISQSEKLNLSALQKQQQTKPAIGFLLYIHKKTPCLKSLINKILCRSNRHWCCIRRFDKNYVLLDSLFDQPLFFGTFQQVLNFVDLQLGNGGEIVIVRKGYDNNKQNIV